MDELLALSPNELKQILAMRPPPGIIPDFANPGRDGSNERETIIGLYFLTGLTILVLLARLYTKFVVLKKHGWEDYTVVLATIGAIAFAALRIHIFNHGFGVHQWNVSISTFLRLVKWLYTITYIYAQLMLLAKLSICFFFLRVFGANAKARYAIYFAILYNTVLQVGCFFLGIFLCIPGKSGLYQCGYKVSKLGVITGGFNIFADVYLLILPGSIIWNLQMGLRRKISLLLVFLAGILACVSSILGFVYRLKQYKSPDATWTFAPDIILITLELDATIMVSCFLALPALFRSQYPLSLSAMWTNRSHIFKPMSWMAPRDQLSNVSSHGSGNSVAMKHSIESDKTPFGKTTPYRGTDSSHSV